MSLKLGSVWKKLTKRVIDRKENKISSRDNRFTFFITAPAHDNNEVGQSCQGRHMVSLLQEKKPKNSESWEINIYYSIHGKKVWAEGSLVVLLADAPITNRFPLPL